MTARDRFLDLPDRLICNHILTKLPLNEFIRCSAVSRRWKRFWTLLPDLRFTHDFFSSLTFAIHTYEKHGISQIELVDSNAVESIIDNILMLRSEHIRTFELCNTCWFHHKIRQWILSVASKGVIEIMLNEIPTDWSDFDPIEVPSALFSCNKLVYLKLRAFDLTRMPAYFGGFQYLKMFCIMHVKLNEEVFELLVKLCPLLESLSLIDFNGITNLKLVSQSLKTLYLECTSLDTDSMISITANCPQLTSLIIEDCAFSVMKLEVNCPLLVHLSTSESYILEGITMLKSLRKLVLGNVHDINILSKFPNIEELCIDQWDDRLPQALELNESKLKKVHILDTSSANIAVLGHLLRRTPSLEAVTFSLYSVEKLEFVNRLLSVMSPTFKILVSQQKYGNITCRNCYGSISRESISAQYSGAYDFEFW